MAFHDKLEACAAAATWLNFERSTYEDHTGKHDGRRALGNAMRGLRWRAALMVVGAALVVMWILATGGADRIIQIDYSWTGDQIEGAEVVIDGEVVGTLERLHGQPVNGFRVDKGEHVVSVRNEDCNGRPERVDTSDGRLFLFMADLKEGFVGGHFRCTITLNN